LESLIGFLGTICNVDEQLITLLHQSLTALQRSAGDKFRRGPQRSALDLWLNPTVAKHDRNLTV